MGRAQWWLFGESYNAHLLVLDEDGLHVGALTGVSYSGDGDGSTGATRDAACDQGIGHDAAAEDIQACM